MCALLDDPRRRLRLGGLLTFVAALLTAAVVVAQEIVPHATPTITQSPWVVWLSLATAALALSQGIVFRSFALGEWTQRSNDSRKAVELLVTRIDQFERVSGDALAKEHQLWRALFDDLSAEIVKVHLLTATNHERLNGVSSRIDDVVSRTKGGDR